MAMKIHCSDVLFSGSIVDWWPMCHPSRSITTSCLRLHFLWVLLANDWAWWGYLLAQAHSWMWDSSDGQFWCKISRWPGWTFLGTVLKPETLPFQMAILIFFLHGSQLNTVVWMLPLPSAEPSLSFSNISPDTFLAHIILAWCLLLRGPQLTQVPN